MRTATHGNIVWGASEDLSQFLTISWIIQGQRNRQFVLHSRLLYPSSGLYSYRQWYNTYMICSTYICMHTIEHHGTYATSMYIYMYI